MIGLNLEQFETPKEQIGSALGNVKTTTVKTPTATTTRKTTTT